MGLITISGCGDNTSARKHKAKATNVHVTKVLRQGLTQQQLITGTIEALSTVRIYNQETGRIKDLPFYPGDTVNKNQLIAVLDDAILLRQFEKARAQHRHPPRERHPRHRRAAQGWLPAGKNSCANYRSYNSKTT